MYAGGPRQGGPRATLCVSSQVNYFPKLVVDCSWFQDLELARKLLLAAWAWLSVLATSFPIGKILTWYLASDQVGCQMSCTFCATGTMGLVGNVSAGEIVEQLVHATRITPIRNVVFMVRVFLELIW